MSTVKACTNNNNYRSVLSLSPFGIPYSENVFISIGCDGLAILYNDTGGYVAGCSSVCYPPPTAALLTEGCYGYQCCQREIDSQYANYGGAPMRNYSILVTVSDEGTCRSAFLLSLGYLPIFLAAKLVDHDAFPVQLSWEIAQKRSLTGRESGTSVLGGIFTIVCYDIFPVLAPSILSCCCFWQCWRYKTKNRRKEIKLREKYFRGRLNEQGCSNQQEEVQKTKLFTMKGMRKATDNFNENRIVGKGGQGAVYKGMLKDGQIIAVKRPKTFDESHWKEFINEVMVFSQVNHRNIVKLFGCCLETEMPLLVYEFIPNGTLSDHLHHTTNDNYSLTWETRLTVASEVASAIAYLHSATSNPIYHRDIKFTNILLDDNYRAKVSDFGISRTISIEQTHLTTNVQGTLGYLDPEYFQSSQFSEKSDVYSFGVVLLELLTGQKPATTIQDNNGRNLVMHFISLVDDSAMYEMMDPIVLRDGSTEKEIVMEVANLAKRCLNSRGIERPTMMEVAMQLEGLRQKSLVISAQ